MKRLVRILLVCVLLTGPAFLVGKLLRGQARVAHPEPLATPSPGHQIVAPTTNLPPAAPSPSPRIISTHLVLLLNAPNGNPQQDVESVSALIRLYTRAVRNRQSLPIGDDRDLVRVLTGHNPIHAVFLPPGHPALSADGRLVDRWGTPYFLHALGRNVFEVRSAGPDRILRTADDIVDGAPMKNQRTDIPDDFTVDEER